MAVLVQSNMEISGLMFFNDSLLRFLRLIYRIEEINSEADKYDDYTDKLSQYYPLAQNEISQYACAYRLSEYAHGNRRSGKLF